MRKACIWGYMVLLLTVVTACTSVAYSGFPPTEPTWNANDFEPFALPSDRELANFDKQDILGFTTGGGLSTICYVDFGDFECTFCYNYAGGTAGIDIVTNPDAVCFSVKSYRDLADRTNWYVIGTDIKSSGCVTTRGAGVGDSRADVLRAYGGLDIREVKGLEGLNVYSSINRIEEYGGDIPLLYLDNSFMFAPDYFGPQPEGARGILFLFDDQDRVGRIIFFLPTAG